MKDFDICIGTRDIPTPLDGDDNNIKYDVHESLEETKKKEKMGLIKDSTSRWYDPNNYIDSLYADW